MCASRRAPTPATRIDRSLNFVFRPALHDNGEKTFLGQTGNFDADDVVDIILRQDAAPAHFATKLFEFFAYPGPDDATIAPIAPSPATRTSTRSRSCAPSSRRTPSTRRRPTAPSSRARPTTPIGALRLFAAPGAPQPAPLLVVAASRNMGQVLFDPPNVAGWPGGRTWLGTSTWFARVNFAAALMNGVPRTARGSVTPADPSAVFPTPPASADDAVTQAALATVDGVLSDDARRTLIDYLDEGGGFASLSEATRQDRLRGLLALLIASPDYQLA